MRQLSEAQFEERRHQWLNDILEQWISEHRGQPGLSLDVTQSMIAEGDKLLDKLLEQERMDVPQALLLKVARIADFFDRFNETWTAIHARAIEQSGSNAEWRLPAQSSKQAADVFIASAREAGSGGLGNFFVGALGAVVMLVPVVGPTVGGGMMGGAVGSEIDRRALAKRAKRLAEFPQLLRLRIAASQAVTTSTTVELFLSKQGLPSHTHLYAVDAGNNETQLLLGPARGRPWFLRPFTSSRAPSLVAVESPALAAA